MPFRLISSNERKITLEVALLLFHAAAAQSSEGCGLSLIGNDQESLTVHYKNKLSSLNLEPRYIEEDERFELRDKSDGALAMDYSYECHEEELIIGLISTTEKWRGKGISYLALVSGLIDCPGTKKISSMLFDTNRRAYDRAVFSGSNPTEALKATPAYRIRALLGFTEIRSSRVEWFTVTKP